MSEQTNEPKQQRTKPDIVDLTMMGVPMFAGIYFSGGEIDNMTIAGFCFGIMLGWVGSKIYRDKK